MCSQMTFDYTPAPDAAYSPTGPSGLLTDDASASNESKATEDEAAMLMLPMGHEQAYSERQRRVMRQRTLGLRRHHFQQYPYFYKSAQQVTSLNEKPRELDPLEESKYNFNRHYAFNAPTLSPGEAVLGLRQAFRGIANSEFTTRSANAGVDDSVEVTWSASGVRTEVVDPDKDKREAAAENAAKAPGRSRAKLDDEEEAEETESSLQRRLMIEKKIKVLKSEDDEMWKAVLHRRKVEAARQLQSEIIKAPVE
jgi:hypothetical protein